MINCFLSPLQFLACVCVHVCTLVQARTCVCVVIVFFVQILVSFPRMDLPYLLTWFEWVVVSIKILELSILSVSISFTIKDCVERFLDVVVYILYLLFLFLHLPYIISSIFSLSTFFSFFMNKISLKKPRTTLPDYKQQAADISYIHPLAQKLKLNQFITNQHCCQNIRNQKEMIRTYNH